VPVSKRLGAAADTCSGQTGRQADAAFPAPSRRQSSRYSRRVPGRAADTGTPGRRRGSRTARSGPSLLVDARGAGRKQGVLAFPFGVQARLGTQGAVTLGRGELLRGPQPGLVLPDERFPLPGRVLAGLPGQLAGIGFSLSSAGELGLGRTNRHRRLRTGPVTFRACRLGDPDGLGDLRLSTGHSALRLNMGPGNLLSQLPAGRGGLLTSTACLGHCCPTRLHRREHLLLGLGGTCLGGDRTRLGTTAGRFGLR